MDSHSWWPRSASESCVANKYHQQRGPIHWRQYNNPVEVGWALTGMLQFLLIWQIFTKFRFLISAHHFDYMKVKKYMENDTNKTWTNFWGALWRSLFLQSSAKQMMQWKQLWAEYQHVTSISSSLTVTSFMLILWRKKDEIYIYNCKPILTLDCTLDITHSGWLGSKY